MRVYQTNEIKNIALLGSAGSGKTRLPSLYSLVAALSNAVAPLKAKTPSATISLLNKSMATLYSQLFSM